MTPDTRAPYKEIIHDVLATNYSVSRNEAPEIALGPLYPSAYLPPLNLCAATPEEERRIRRGCRRGPYGIFGRVAQRGKSAPFLTPCGSSRKMSTRRPRLICNRNCQIFMEGYW
ncbi:hypothetical protein ALC56_09277 [Trachymyrmex septentrionalis]|uniref:Uncharacterized protein n=1 Tax=Trachymyrmex septentrionalis TaxID=34720 RepID=A0A195F802_9HYME|nr:hypothetical protein ALC56_09277 [Trachymyrmex septentrionalis]